MPRGRPIEPVVLTDDEKDQLLSLANSRSLPHGVVRRAQIVLACAQGEANASIARRLRLSDATVGKWRKRYRLQGIEGLHDELRAGRPRTHDDERVAEVINTALQTRPPDGATHWSVRPMAEQSGVSKSTVQRWFSLFAIQPHRQRYFKLSNDPFFVEKVRDIVGLYLNPPDHAVVLVEEEANVAILSDRLEHTQATATTMRGLASRVPEVEAALANLNRDYEIIQAQHEEFLARRESAKVSRDREIKADQVQFRVVEPPVVPVAPSGPPRLIFLTVTLIAGIGAGIGFAWVLVMSNDTIANLGRLREMFALPVLGAVSTVDTITKRGWTMLHSSTFIGVFGLLIVFYAGLILVERQIGLANLVSEELISAYYNRVVAIAAEPALNVLNTLSERLIAILTEMLGR